jgi:hypothetical protein
VDKSKEFLTIPTINILMSRFGRSSQDDAAGLIIRDRLVEADLDSNRIISLNDGSKAASFDHTRKSNRYDTNADNAEGGLLAIDGDPTQNYGIYAGDGLVIFDIDDHDAVSDELRSLPETFTTQTPHDGEHRYYLVDGDLGELETEFDVTNPQPQWGEIRVQNQYVVGPGSQLDGCDKDWCDECATESGGRYTIAQDRAIETITIDDLVDVIEADPNYTTDSDDQDGHTSSEASTDIDPDQIGFDGDLERRLAKARETDDTLDGLWRGNYTAAGYGDRSSAECALAWRLAFWFEKDKDVVRRLMDQANTEKWGQRTDTTYRDSVLEAVDQQPDIYTGLTTSPQSINENTLADIEVTTSESDISITWDEAHKRCLNRIIDAIEDEQQVLIEALPTVGKSLGAVEAVAELGVQTTILTQREDLYDEVQERCEVYSLDYEVLPAVSRSCPTYQREHGEAARNRIKSLHDNGASARSIHEYFKSIGDPLPCQHNGPCPSRDAWEFDPDANDILIGHYLHANMPKAIKDRHVVFDEFVGDSYDTDLEHGEISPYLAKHTDFGSVIDLFESRGEDLNLDMIGARVSVELATEGSTGGDSVTDRRVHTKAPEASKVLLHGDSQTVNGYERYGLDGKTVGVYDRGEGVVTIRDPPSLEDAKAVVALDGTPVKRLWESALGLDLNHERVLTTPERKQYLTNVAGYEFVQTTEYVYPYSNSQNVGVKKDRALIEEIRQRHDRWPTLISTKKAINRYQSGFPDAMDEINHEHYGNLKSSNEFATEDLGLVVGSRHFGRPYIKKEAAFLGREIDPEGQALEKTYNDPYADRLLHRMREDEVFQAAMRFGRDSDVDHARVYIHTAAVPEWVPREQISTEISPHSDGMRQVLDALDDMDEPCSTPEVVEHDAVDVSRKQVSNLLNELDNRGIVDKRRDGRANVYHDQHLDDINEYGFVNLETT